MGNCFSNTCDQSYPTYDKDSNLENEAKGPKTSSMQVASNLCTNVYQILEQINMNCKQGNISEALAIVKTHVPINSDHVKKNILKELLSSIIECVKLLQTDISIEECERAFNVMCEIIYEYNLCDSELCSVIITDCFQQNVFPLKAEELLNVCTKKSISLTIEAISAYAKFINSIEYDISKFLTFFESVKQVSDFAFPITEFNNLLDKCSRKENFFQIPFSEEFKRLFRFLCSANSNEVGCQSLQKFLYCCIQNEHWNQIVEFFRASVKKNKFLHCLHQTFAVALGDCGSCFEKFAAVFHGNIACDIPMHHLALFGQIGVALMLESFSKGEQKSALEILYVLHKYQINYYELQIPVCFLNSSDQRFQELGSPFEYFILPHNIVFTAVDICLHFGRTKDAFEILNSFSFLLSDEGFKSEYKSYVTVKSLMYLLRLAGDLIHTDPLNRGIKLMRNLLTTIEKEIASEDINLLGKDLKNFYNEFIIEVMNRKELTIALEFYQFYCGTLREFLIMQPHVLRGLVTTFADNGFVEEAKELFHIGLSSENVYSLEKPNVEDICWCLTLGSSWTRHEIKLAIETYIELLFPVLFLKHSKSDDEEWFPIKIMFREDENHSGGVKCLNEEFKSPESALKETCIILKSLDSDLIWKESACEKSLIVPAENFYNYWKREMKAENSSTKFLKLPTLNIKENATSSVEKDEESSCIRRIDFERNMISVKNVEQNQISDKNVDNIIETSTFHNEIKTQTKLMTILTPHCEKSLASPSFSFSSSHSLSNSHVSPFNSLTNSPIKNSNISPVYISPNKRLSVSSINSCMSSPTKVWTSTTQRSPKNLNLVSSPKSSIPVSPYTEEYDTNCSIAKEQTICISDNKVSNSSEVKSLAVINTVIDNQKESSLSACKMQVSAEILKKSAVTDTTAILNEKQITVEKSTDECPIIEKSSHSISTIVKPLTNVAKQSSALPIVSQKRTSTLNPCKKLFSDDKFSITSKIKSAILNEKQKTMEKSTDECPIIEKRSHSISTIVKPLTNVAEQSSVLPTVSQKRTNSTLNPCKKLFSHDKFPKASKIKSLKTKKMKLKNSKCVPKRKLSFLRKDKLCIVVNNKSRVITSDLNKPASQITTQNLSTVKLSTTKSGTSNNSNSSLSSHEEFDKIVHFLKTKILLKCKNLNPEQQHQKAVDLTRLFISEHNIQSKLDKKSMKFLFEFADKNV